MMGHMAHHEITSRPPCWHSILSPRIFLVRISHANLLLQGLPSGGRPYLLQGDGATDLLTWLDNRAHDDKMLVIADQPLLTHTTEAQMPRIGSSATDTEHQWGSPC